MVGPYAIGEDGRFDAPTAESTLPGSANAILRGGEITSQLTLHGTICGVSDFYCGSVTGTVSLPVQGPPRVISGSRCLPSEDDLPGRPRLAAPKTRWRPRWSEPWRSRLAAELENALAVLLALLRYLQHVQRDLADATRAVQVTQLQAIAGVLQHLAQPECEMAHQVPALGALRLCLLFGQVSCRGLRGGRPTGAAGAVTRAGAGSRSPRAGAASTNSRTLLCATHSVAVAPAERAPSNWPATSSAPWAECRAR